MQATSYRRFCSVDRPACSCQRQSKAWDSRRAPRTTSGWDPCRYSYTAVVPWFDKQKEEETDKEKTRPLSRIQDNPARHLANVVDLCHGVWYILVVLPLCCRHVSLPHFWAPTTRKLGPTGRNPRSLGRSMERRVCDTSSPASST